jgi:hypothetical protein
MRTPGISIGTREEPLNPEPLDQEGLQLTASQGSVDEDSGKKKSEDWHSFQTS